MQPVSSCHRVRDDDDENENEVLVVVVVVIVDADGSDWDATGTPVDSPADKDHGSGCPECGAVVWIPFHSRCCYRSCIDDGIVTDHFQYCCVALNLGWTCYHTGNDGVVVVVVTSGGEQSQ